MVEETCAILLPHSPRLSAQRSHTKPEGSLHSKRFDWLLPPKRSDPPASRQLCEAGLSDELACAFKAPNIVHIANSHAHGDEIRNVIKTINQGLF